jgi:hypothetical protein
MSLPAVHRGGIPVPDLGPHPASDVRIEVGPGGRAGVCHDLDRTERPFPFIRADGYGNRLALSWVPDDARCAVTASMSGLAALVLLRHEGCHACAGMAVDAVSQNPSAGPFSPQSLERRLADSSRR